ncbi:MAG: GNAT family N-acetyltransferase [Myxococcaceae bacterium]|nr:GNAT family N-acetyltransferase [Myxococcaceae bacterium]MCI0673465.1 GNAT family N-acetyltransferase [Myxococcaceae bacterium]
MPRPTLHTPRLTLRPFALPDAADVRRLVGEYDVARDTLAIPHPYEKGMAERWISTHESAFERGEELIFAIALRDSDALRGAIGIRLAPVHAHGELGYWVGKPWWGQGLATEAARGLLDHAFGTLGLARVWAQHFSRNPASGRVMQKLGMRHEGHLRQHYCRFGERLDVDVYGLLAEEWPRAQSGQ